MTRTMLGAVGVLTMLGGCGGGPAAPASEPSPAASQPAPVAASSAPRPATSVAPPSPSATVSTDDAAEMEWDNLAGTIDKDGPPAPCDLSRFYRGSIGKGGYSVVLSRAGSQLRGFAAYDAGHGDLALAGSVAPNGTITLAEKKNGHDVGTIAATCDPATGTITGSWTDGGKTQPITLKPRQPGGVGLVERVHEFGPRQQAEPVCSWTVRSPAVFGLGAPERAARINRALEVRFEPSYAAELERGVKRCPPQATRLVTGWYSIEVNTQGLLSVLHNGYVYFGPAAHGVFNAPAGAVSIDVATGRKLALSDIVTSSKALRPVVRSCMKFLTEQLDGGDPWWWERAIQGVPTDKRGEPVEEGSPEFVASSLYEPTFLVLPDGLAVLIRNQPTVSSGLELTGPVIRWSALQRAKVLEPRSPIKRLWAGAAPLAPSEPACVRYFEPRWNTPVPRK